MMVHSFHRCTVFSPQDPFQENYQRFDSYLSFFSCRYMCVEGEKTSAPMRSGRM